MGVCLSCAVASVTVKARTTAAGVHLGCLTVVNHYAQAKEFAVGLSLLAKELQSLLFDPTRTGHHL